MNKTLKELELTNEANVNLTFEEYQKIRENPIQIILNDFAWKAIEKAKSEGKELSHEGAIELAKNEIPTVFVPEWIRNLRIEANKTGMEQIYLDRIAKGIEETNDLLRCIFESQLEEYIQRHANDFRRQEMIKDNDTE